jgi:hypothetical protein
MEDTPALSCTVEMAYRRLLETNFQWSKKIYFCGKIRLQKARARTTPEQVMALG